MKTAKNIDTSLLTDDDLFEEIISSKDIKISV